jgi:serine/threonine-protein kinase RsbW
MPYEAGDRAGELTFSGPAGPACLEQVHQLIRDLWDQEPEVAETDRYSFATALVELVSNVIQHGRTENGAAPDLVLRMNVDRERIQALLLDNGLAFDVEVNAGLPDDGAGSGRGLALARAASDQLEYTRTEQLNGWFLSRRRRSPAPDGTGRAEPSGTP